MTTTTTMMMMIIIIIMTITGMSLYISAKGVYDA